MHFCGQPGAVLPPASSCELANALHWALWPHLCRHFCGHLCGRSCLHYAGVSAPRAHIVRYLNNFSRKWSTRGGVPDGTWRVLKCYHFPLSGCGWLLIRNNPSTHTVHARRLILPLPARGFVGTFAGSRARSSRALAQALHNALWRTPSWALLRAPKAVEVQSSFTLHQF